MDKQEEALVNPTRLDPKTGLTDGSIDSILKCKKDEWGTIWLTKDQTKRLDTLRLLTVLRNVGLASNDADKHREAFSVKQVRKTCQSFKKNTSIGVDLWTFRELAACTDDDLARLGRLLANSIRKICMPSQGYLNVMNLLATKRRRHTHS